MDGKFYGIYRGKVVNNKDPNGHRRLMITIPQIMGTDSTGWAWPIDGPGISLPIPGVGQGIWVMFEGGDPSYPIWAGQFGRFSSQGGALVVKKAPTISGYLVSGTGVDGTPGLDLMATLVNMSQKIIELEGRVSALE
jgi:hypothetical protein